MRRRLGAVSAADTIGQTKRRTFFHLAEADDFVADLEMVFGKSRQSQ
ncbi:hypothetical protein SDC9_168953 [bioreactor metagenome]|uniref:Uncharacterized protein n=1 Tax=bioreactor metagenome TaxID=1076179 RepID=A0A645GCI0_9ZZZZ